MSWNVKIAKRVLKELKRIPLKDAQRLLSVLEKMSENPFTGDIEKIGGEEKTWRRRVGSYRILYEIFPSQKSTLIFDIRRRTTSTY